MEVKMKYEDFLMVFLGLELFVEM